MSVCVLDRQQLACSHLGLEASLNSEGVNLWPCAGGDVHSSLAHRPTRRSIKLTQNIHTLPSEINHLMSCCSCKSGTGPFRTQSENRIPEWKRKEEKEAGI